MTPAERKFSDVETGLLRAQCLIRVLRDFCETGRGDVDPILWGGIFIIVGEAETAVDAAVGVWSEAHALAVAPD